MDLSLFISYFSVFDLADNSQTSLSSRSPAMADPESQGSPSDGKTSESYHAYHAFLLSTNPILGLSLPINFLISWCRMFLEKTRL